MEDTRSLPGHGGTVEPATRATPEKEVENAPRPAAGPQFARFELRDPTTDLMHHAKTFDAMVTKAEQLHALRFTAIDGNNQRSFVHKVDGAWQRPPPLEPERAEARTATPAKVVPLTPAVGTEPGTQQPNTRDNTEAERAALLMRIETALNERYIVKRALITVGNQPIGHMEYRFRGDTTRVAFTESPFRLATDTNSPSVARSMVDVAEARQWNALRVSGHEEFRRQVWFEAALRGVKTIGYEPMPSDQAWLRSAREARQVNRIEPTPTTDSPSANGKASARGEGRGSRKTVLAAIDAVLVAQRVPEQRREAIMAAAADNLAKRLAAGEVHKVKVYDKAAPTRRPVVTPTPAHTQQPQRTRERAAPVR